MKRLVYFSLFFVTTFSFGQDGSPDLSFGENGVVIYEPEGEDFEITSAIETNEGNILTVVSTFNGSKIFAYTEDGLPLIEFGNDGVLDISELFGYGIGISNLNGEGFLLRGFNSNQLTVSKHFNDGSLDENFGNSGYIQPFLGGGSGNQVIVDTENRIIVSGKVIVSEVHHVLKKRFMENGLPDESFGINGQVLFPVNDMVNLIVRSLKIRGDNYYSSISYNDNIQSYRSIIRSDLNGNIDTSFGQEGILQIPIESDYFTSFDVFENGIILIGGMYFDYKTDNIFRKTIKIDSQGQQIQNFGNNGQIIGRSGFFVQQNQRFLADASYFDFEGGTMPYYIRYFPNGTLDNSFQFGSNYPDLIGSSVMLHLQSGKFMLISSDIWYNWPDIKISLQRFNNSPLSVSDFEKVTVAVYPNPSNAIFQIHNNIPFNNDSYVIFDSLGQKVLSGQFNESFPYINMGNFAAGVYFLKIENIPQTIKLLKK